MAIGIGDNDRIEDELALQRLNADFCYYLDHNETDSLIDLFTADANYSHGERLSNGRDEIHELFETRNASGKRTARHIQSGLRFEFIDKQLATGKSVCITFAADQAPPISGSIPHLVADFVDDYVLCADGRWRISRRHIERIFTSPNNEGPVGGS